MLIDGNVRSPRGAGKLGVRDDLVRDPAVPDPSVDGDRAVFRGDQVRVGDVDGIPGGRGALILRLGAPRSPAPADRRRTCWRRVLPRSSDPRAWPRPRQTTRRQGAQRDSATSRGARKPCRSSATCRRAPGWSEQSLPEHRWRSSLRAWPRRRRSACSPEAQRVASRRYGRWRSRSLAFDTRWRIRPGGSAATIRRQPEDETARPDRQRVPVAAPGMRRAEMRDVVVTDKVGLIEQAHARFEAWRTCPVCCLRFRTGMKRPGNPRRPRRRCRSRSRRAGPAQTIPGQERRHVRSGTSGRELPGWRKR